MLLARNRAMIIQLDNIIFSIPLVKVDILNPLLLDNREINSLIENEHFTNITITDLMLASKFKVLQNNVILVFLVKYPKPKLVCKKLLIFPVTHNNTILHLEENSVAVCGKNAYSVDDCAGAAKQFGMLLPKRSCAQQLMSDEKARCEITFSHLSPIEEVSDGLVIIKNEPITIKTVNHTTNLVKGTYVVTFDNRVILNGTEYFNRNGMSTRTAEIPLNVEIDFSRYKEMLSWPYLKHHSMQNRQLIKSMYSDLERKSAITVGSIVIIAISIVLGYILFYKLRQRKKKQSARELKMAINRALKRTEDAPRLSGEELSSVTSTE